MFSSVIAAPSSVRTTWPRENTSTRSHSPCSSTTSEESTTTACPALRLRGAAPGRARGGRRRRRRASARRPAARPARASSERANSTFCWLPPESDETASPCRACARRAARSAPRRARPRAARWTTPARATPLEREQRDVLAHGQRQQERPRRGGRRAGRRCRALRPDRVAERDAACRASMTVPLARSETRERAQELALAVALDACEPDDLARPDVEADIVEARAGEAAARSASGSASGRAASPWAGRPGRRSAR